MPACAGMTTAKEQSVVGKDLFYTRRHPEFSSGAGNRGAIFLLLDAGLRRHDDR
jgi:hypothetical protein